MVGLAGRDPSRQRETSRNDSRGVAYNGSHCWATKTLGDCLYGLRGRMRMSVYEEAEASYLVRTEDLNAFHEKWYRLIR
jgi:hypothetical protein